MENMLLWLILHYLRVTQKHVDVEIIHFCPDDNNDNSPELNSGNGKVCLVLVAVAWTGAGV